MVLRIAATWPVFNDTIDEPYHLGSGLAWLQSKRHAFGIQHPPLPRIVAALPLYASGARSADPHLKDRTDDLHAFVIGHEVLLAGKYSYWTTLTISRGGMILFPIACVIYVYLLGKYLGNRLIGTVAAVFFSTDPTLLGHGTWIATDVAACAGYLAGTYHGLRLIARPTLGRALAAGIAIGAALACKFSCIIVLPALGVLWLLRGQRALCTAKRFLPFSLLSFVVAFLTLWTTYSFEFGRVDRLRMLNPDELHALPDWLRQTPLPMPTVIAGLSILAQHNQQGHPAYLLGQFSKSGWWYYFPVAMVLKSPVAMLLGTAVAAIALVVTGRRRRLRPLAILVPLAAFLAMSMTARINIGVRHILPAIPFIYLFIAMVLARGRLIGFALALIVLAFVETATVHPDYVAFFNSTVGGPGNGEKYLLDSNLDWGQDLWRLKNWLEQNARGRTVTLRVFGNPRLRQWPLDSSIVLAPEDSPPRGLFAVSRNYSHDVYPYVVTDRDGQRRIAPPMSWIRQRKPLAQVGYSIEIYDLGD